MNNNKERKCLCSIADVKPSTRQRNARLRQPTPHARNRTLLPRLNIKPKATPRLTAVFVCLSPTHALKLFARKASIVYRRGRLKTSVSEGLCQLSGSITHAVATLPKPRMRLSTYTNARRLRLLFNNLPYFIICNKLHVGL